MNKTLHRKLSEKHIAEITPDGYAISRYVPSPEKKLMQEVAKELLQPRPQAVANILKMAREL